LKSTVVRIAIVCAVVLWSVPLHAQVRLDPEHAGRLLTDKAAPVYPPLARQAKIQGAVRVELTVSETGTVVSARVIDGHSLLATAALDAAKKWKYRPYLVTGIPTSFVTVVEVEFSLGFPKEQYEERPELTNRYIKEEDRCRTLLKSEKWKEAEEACKTAVPFADQLGHHQGLTKMGAYEHVGHALLGQRRYQEALDYYSRAFEFAQASLKETDAELGYAYRDLALAHHGIGNLEKARELYRRAEDTLELAHSKIQSEDLKHRYEQALKQILRYHLLAAEEAGAKAEADGVRKRLSALP
jgi:TonB family protein